MRRKILRVGSSSLAISLPKKWANRCKLRSGEEVDIYEQGNGLLVKPPAMLSDNTATLDISTLHPLSTQTLGMLYKVGYKRIKAWYTPNKTVIHRGHEVTEADMIKNVFDHLNGMQLWEIGSQKDRGYLIANETSLVNPEEFPNVFNRLYVYLLNQADHTMQTIETGKEGFSEAYLAERLINQTSDFCLKILISFGLSEYKKSLFYYDLTTTIEALGDLLFQLALHHKQNRSHIDHDTLVFLREVVSALHETWAIYQKFSLERATALAVHINSLIQQIETLINNNKLKGSLHTFAVYSLLRSLLPLEEKLFFLNNESFRENLGVAKVLHP